MATRALYIFKDSDTSITVYKHWDGYPSEDGAYSHIAKALPYAWDLPRFEADDFASAFIAGNKPKGGGDVRCLNEASTNGDALGVEYIYTVEANGDNQVKVTTVALWEPEKAFDIVYLSLED